MFGYVVPYKEELKVKEYDIFKGYYCGLCKVLGKEFNQFSRLGLNYDLTFLGLLLSSMDEKNSNVAPESCVANPFKKRPIVKPNRNIKYSGYMGIILIYFKLIDDWKDEKSIKALSALLVYLLPIRKAKKVYRKKYAIIKNYLNQLTILEKEKCSIIDKSADVFGKLMADIAVPPFIEDEREKRVLSWLGYNLGRWIYILDAFNDIHRDIKNKNYNPIILQYEYNIDEDINDFVNRVTEPIEFSLTFTADNIAKSFELLDIKYNRGLIENIIYMGIRRKMNTILKRRRDNYEKSL